MKMFVCRYLMPATISLLATVVLGQEIKSHPEGQRLLDMVKHSDIEWDTCGFSNEGRPIVLTEFGSGKETLIILGGFHGDEFSGVELVQRFADYLQMELPELPARVVIVPVVNPDGLLRGTRVNARAVDVNRNFPTENWKAGSGSAGTNPGPSPASEAETRVVIALLEKYQPDRIVSVHAPLRMVNYDGPAQALAEVMAGENDYPVSSDIGYPTPGSFGTYAGVEKQIPTITLELPEDELGNSWTANRDALTAAIHLNSMDK